MKPIFSRKYPPAFVITYEISDRFFIRTYQKFGANKIQKIYNRNFPYRNHHKTALLFLRHNRLHVSERPNVA